MSELVVIVVVAFLVLGPERLLRTARAAGFFWARAHRQWRLQRYILEQELYQKDVVRFAEKENP